MKKEKLYCNSRGNQIEYTTVGFNFVETNIYNLRIITGMYLKESKEMYETVVLQSILKKKYIHNTAEEAILFHNRLCRTLSYIRYKKGTEEDV